MRLCLEGQRLHDARHLVLQPAGLGLENIVVAGVLALRRGCVILHVLQDGIGQDRFRIDRKQQEMQALQFVGVSQIISLEDAAQGSHGGLEVIFERRYLRPQFCSL